MGQVFPLDVILTGPFRRMAGAWRRVFLSALLSLAAYEFMLHAWDPFTPGNFPLKMFLLRSLGIGYAGFGPDLFAAAMESLGALTLLVLQARILLHREHEGGLLKGALVLGWRWAWMGFALELGALLGFAAVFFPGFLFLATFGLAPMAAVMDDQGLVSAFGASRRLGAGRFWLVLLRLAVLASAWAAWHYALRYLYATVWPVELVAVLNGGLALPWALYLLADLYDSLGEASKGEPAPGPLRWGWWLLGGVGGLLVLGSFFVWLWLPQGGAEKVQARAWVEQCLPFNLVQLLDYPPVEQHDTVDVAAEAIAPGQPWARAIKAASIPGNFVAQGSDGSALWASKLGMCALDRFGPDLAPQASLTMADQLLVYGAAMDAAGNGYLLVSARRALFCVRKVSSDLTLAGQWPVDIETFPKGLAIATDGATMVWAASVGSGQFFSFDLSGTALSQVRQAIHADRSFNSASMAMDAHGGLLVSSMARGDSGTVAVLTMLSVTAGGNLEPQWEFSETTTALAAAPVA
ncbi:MAG TPA: hypothetical protein VNZ54_11625, partial [bacterium]|nr:hypothetical protein [bacterium]